MNCCSLVLPKIPSLSYSHAVSVQGLGSQMCPGLPALCTVLLQAMWERQHLLQTAHQQVEQNLFESDVEGLMSLTKKAEGGLGQSGILPVTSLAKD